MMKGHFSNLVDLAPESVTLPYACLLSTTVARYHYLRVDDGRIDV